MADAVVRLDTISDNTRPVDRAAQAPAAMATAPSRLDLALVARLQAGAEEAYEELIGLYQQPAQKG